MMTQSKVRDKKKGVRKKRGIRYDEYTPLNAPSTSFDPVMTNIHFLMQREKPFSKRCIILGSSSYYPMPECNKSLLEQKKANGMSSIEIIATP